MDSVSRARDLLAYDRAMNEACERSVREAWATTGRLICERHEGGERSDGPAGAPPRQDTHRGTEPPANALPALERARAILAHHHAARRLWLSRIEGEPWRGELFPQNVTEDALAQFRRDADADVGRFSDRLTEEMLARKVRYVSTEGDALESRIADIVMHLGMHGSYHRGQVAMLLGRTGVQPPMTDHILWTRRPADPA